MFVMIFFGLTFFLRAHTCLRVDWSIRKSVCFVLRLLGRSALLCSLLESVTILSVSFIKGIEERSIVCRFQSDPHFRSCLESSSKRRRNSFGKLHFGFCRVQSEEFDVIEGMSRKFFQFRMLVVPVKHRTFPAITVLNQSIVSVNIQALHVIGSLVALVDFL